MIVILMSSMAELATILKQSDNSFAKHYQSITKWEIIYQIEDGACVFGYWIF